MPPITPNATEYRYRLGVRVFFWGAIAVYLSINIKTIFLTILLLVIGCSESDSENEEPESNNIIEKSIILLDRSSVYSTKIDVIPSFIYDSILLEKEIKLGDSTKLEDINLSCTSIGPPKYNSLLQYAIADDNSCLIVYLSGGIGVHHVIEYYKFDELPKYYHHTTISRLHDTFMLKEYLKLNKIDILD